MIEQAGRVGSARRSRRPSDAPSQVQQFQHNYKQPTPWILGEYDEEHMRHQLSVFKVVNER